VLRKCLLTLAALTAVAPAAAHAAFPGRPGKLMFSSTVDGNKNIFAADPAPGSPWQPLTTNPGEDAQAAWSPDGTRIAFRARRTGEHYFEIYLANADGTGERRVTFTPRPANDALPYSSQPSWSPDGAQIVFRSNRDGEPDVWVMDADGTDARQVADDPADERYPSFSPDGTRIAFTSTRDGDTDLYTIARDGGAAQKLTHNAVYDSAPAWSPDGARIAFERGAKGDDPTNELWTMAAAGGDERRLTENDVLDEGAAWSPDGTRIAFTSARSDPDGDIFVMNADGSVQQLVAGSPALEESPDWQSLPPGGTPQNTDGTKPPPGDPLTPGGDLPLLETTPARRHHLATPLRIRLSTLLKRGLPLRVACDPQCRATARLFAPPRRPAVARRAVRLGPIPLRVRLKVAHRTATRLRRERPKRLLVRVAFLRDGEAPRVLVRRVRIHR
jgi:dipeptidyl aminopeptidase/acylaminoacyl peptidase